MSDNYFVSWKPQYSVRIDVIDRQHQALIALTRDPQEAVGREGPRLPNHMGVAILERRSRERGIGAVAPD
jgi:hypothetical protein